ncbi:TetR/AcrR family transcriptional regulator [Actinomadura fibrosa]|uniref:TetR family transcriptional regulator C-terminal domain-containing protein n=1 Tax=Actinomadura fibrosa TaxID=111802 RepID=A0ABW2XZB5_9ACTN|nr:TetR/AcrR family transcriptional regulator [Actinomadura fibrosa]
MTGGRAAGRDRDERPGRGDRTRARILRHAMDIASLEGLEGLTIGRLAGELKVSKSGLFAHFGSKEELRLAVVSAAVELFVAQVVRPSMATAPGLPRLLALCENWLGYSERRVFPGGCFLYSVGAEYDARPGRVRDALAASKRDWMALYEQTIRDAQRLGELDPGVDPRQLAFELDALVNAANSAALLLDDEHAYDRALSAIRARLDGAAVPGAPAPPAPG